MPNPKKQEILKQLKENFQKAEAIFFINYQGLNVSQINELRQALNNLNAKLQIAKNSLIHLADPRIELKLPTATVFASANSIEVLKLLMQNIKKFGHSFNIKLGLFEQKLYSPEDLIKFSQLPTREVLISKFMAILKTSIFKVHFDLEYKLKALLLDLKVLSLKKEV